MLNRLLPPSLDNAYRGYRVARWIFGLVVLMRTVVAVNSIFNGYAVMTTADGVVMQTGHDRGEGNFVRIRHTSRIETMYMHLSRFAKNIKRGTKVTQGDVIGYVGATGLVTGPHLDYRVNEGGKWLDPLKLKSITPDPLGGASLAQFRKNVAMLAPQLSSAPLQVAQTSHRRRALF